MAIETILTNARIVADGCLVDGTVRFSAGIITAVESGRSGLRSAIDLEGDFLIPGLVDIHTDNLERHLEPRPGVAWPNLAALLTHDRQIAAAGITTVFDSLCVGYHDDNRAGRQTALVNALQAMEEAQADGLLKVEHLLHLRCEVSSDIVVDAFTRFVDDPLVRLVSVMDHTPGQRQWSDLDRWRSFYSRERLSDAELDDLLERRRQWQAQYAWPSRREIVRITKEKNLALASHDDTTADHILEALADGVTISEFPTSEEAARLARQHGMWIVMGGPNVVLGGSHSGNVSARAMAEAGLVDALASDYAPISLMHACFLFHDVLNWDLPAAVATVSTNPAAMVGLHDRGVIAAGKRADLVRVKAYRHMPVIGGVWRQGQLIA